MTVRKKAAKIPATYDAWLRSLPGDDQRAEYKRAADVYEHRKAYEDFRTLEKSLSEQALPDALIGARFVLRDDDDAQESVSICYKAFYVIGQAGRYYRQLHTRRNEPPEAFLHGRSVMILRDPLTTSYVAHDETATITLGEFFHEILCCYRLDIDETTPAPAFIQRLRRR